MTFEFTPLPCGYMVRFTVELLPHTGAFHRVLTGLPPGVGQRCFLEEVKKMTEGSVEDCHLKTLTTHAPSGRRSSALRVLELELEYEVRGLVACK